MKVEQYKNLELYQIFACKDYRPYSNRDRSCDFHPANEEARNENCPNKFSGMMCYASRRAFEKEIHEFTRPQDGIHVTMENYRRSLSRKHRKEFLLMVKKSQKASDTRQIFLVEGKLKKDWV